MLLPLVPILLSVLSVLTNSQALRTTQPPDSKPISLKPRDPVKSTHIPAPKLPEDTTIRNKDDALPESVGADYIVNGIESPKYSLGYQAKIEACGPGNRCIGCGGTVVHPRYVITAAHCLYNKENFRMRPNNTKFNVIVGELNVCGPPDEGGQWLAASEVFEHENYSNGNGANNPGDNDIAILKLPEDIIFNNQVWPACLPTSPTTDYSGQTVTASGWGKTLAFNGGQQNPEEPEQCKLKQTTLKVQAYSDIECMNILHGARPSSQLCAYAPNTSICKGDSGGPLALERGNRSILLGISSYNRKGCGGGVANVFVRVQGFLPWIAGIVPEDLQFKKSCNAVQ